MGAATSKVAAKAAGKVAAKAATTTAATAKAATRKAGSATKAAAAARTASRTTGRTATTATTTAVKTAPVVKTVGVKTVAAVKPAPAKPTPAKTTAAKAAPAKPTPAKTTAAKATAASKATAAKAPAVKTTPALVVVVKDAPARVDTVPDAVEFPPAETVAALADRRRPAAGRGFAAARRRPALVLAAALVGALGVSVLAGERPAAQAGTTTVSASVSVAEQLGLTGQVDQPVTAADTARLGELAVSRNERDAEQVAAAKAQDAANHAAAQAAAQAAVEAARPDAVLPVKGGRLTSGFGGRWGRLHAGIDLAAPMLTPEYAVMDGIVLEAGASSGYGNAVYIQHENGDVTVYGHMEKVLVRAGQVVRAGDTIALLGNRGRSTGPHLHFEVHVGGLNGQKIDPIPWLRERGINL
jgi:murein DD-endopeptidase MepM/ murein hydrolase activator NlpD